MLFPIEVFQLLLMQSSSAGVQDGKECRNITHNKTFLTQLKCNPLRHVCAHPLPDHVLTCDPLGHPQPASRLQHPGLFAVHQQEGVVVAEGCRVLPALPSLAVLFQEACDDGQCPPGAVASL